MTARDLLHCNKGTGAAMLAAVLLIGCDGLVQSLGTNVSDSAVPAAPDLATPDLAAPLDLLASPDLAGLSDLAGPSDLAAGTSSALPRPQQRPPSPRLLPR